MNVNQLKMMLELQALQNFNHHPKNNSHTTTLFSEFLTSLLTSDQSVSQADDKQNKSIVKHKSPSGNVAYSIN